MKISFLSLTIIVIALKTSLMLCSCSIENDGQQPSTKEGNRHSPKEQKRPPQNYNVVVVVIDALRADHLGTYGYSRNTSPFLDRLAQNGAVFENAYSNSSFTKESIAVLLSSKLPSRSGSIGWSAAPSPSKNGEGLAEILQKAGYKTALFTNSDLITNPKFQLGFDEYDYMGVKWGLSGRGPVLVKRALQFAEKQQKQKFFMYLHFLDPHGPYQPPKEYLKKFSKSKPRKAVKVYKIRSKIPSMVAKGFGPGEQKFDNMVARYDAEISFIDNALTQLLDGMKEMQILDNTLLILTADHGEEFLEHGFVEHAWTLYEESIHIPLIMIMPGVLRHQRIKDRVSLVDLTPTILNLTGIKYENSNMDGTPLFMNNKERFVFNPPTKPYIGELFLQERNVLRTVVKNGWKYSAWRKRLSPVECAQTVKNMKKIRTKINSGEIKPVELWGNVVYEELFNIQNDPNEKKNLIKSHPEKAKELSSILDAYRESCALSSKQRDNKTTPKVELSEEEIKQLEALGYM